MSDKQLTEIEISDKHKAFALEYLSNGFNGKQACITVGYSETSATSTASEILTYPNVREYIRNTLETVVGTMKDVLEKRIIETYYKRAFYDIAKYMDSSGCVDINKINEDGYGCIIDGVKKAQTITTGDNFEKIEPVVYELANRDKALDQLTKYMNLINEKIDLDITTKVILTTQDAGLL